MNLNKDSLGKWLLFVSVLMIASVNIQPVEASIPSGYQSFYVLGDSTKIILEAVDPAVGLPISGANPYSVFSVVSYLDDTRIYVDQRGNGYSFQKSDFTGADAVFRLDKGGVITFDNWASPYYTITPPGSGALLSGSLNNPPAVGIDGGDYFFVAGGPLSVFRGATDRRPETGDGNYIAGMWELYPVEQGGDEAQKSYVVPAGEDTVGTDDFLGGGEVLGGTFAVVQSTENGTLVDFSQKGVPDSRSLNRGESFVIPHVDEGDYVVANNKVQVGLIASGGESYDIRYFTLKDERFTGNDFHVPTFPTGSPPLDVRYHIHAITDALVTVETDAGVEPGWNPRFLAAGTTDASFSTPGDTPVHVMAEKGQRIIILVSVDTGGGDRDWGYVPIDASALVNEYFVPYAPSGRAASHDMQLYVSPIFDGTTIYADYNQDNVIDDMVTLNRVESHGFYDASDMDNTGTHLFADFPFTVVYGESILALAGGSLSGYDWGYTIIPLDYTPANIVLDILKTAFPPTVPISSPVMFTLEVTSGDANVFTILGVDVFDELPPGFTYVGPTTITHTDDSESYEDPSIVGQMLTWDLSEDMQPGETITISFYATSTTVIGENYIDTGRAVGTDPFDNTYSPEATAFVTVAANGVVEGFITDVTLAIPAPVPGVTVELLDCSGTPTVLKTTNTDGNGFYDFVGLLEGEYCVRYDPLDPDLGLLAPYSDDDPTVPPATPLTSSAGFILPQDGIKIHNFQVAVPVNLQVEKTLTEPGDGDAYVGDPVVFTVAVTNTGDLPLETVPLKDTYDPDKLGYVGASPTPDMVDTVGGVLEWTDLTGPGVLDPLSTVIVEISFVAAESTLPESTTDYAEVNDAKALDLEYYVDGSDDDDVTIMDAAMNVDKELTEPPSGYTDIGETIVFTVTITNTGDLPLETVPLKDTYDPAKLGYAGASPTPDTADTVGGVLEWTDLTGPGSLAPGGALIVEITFEALEYTDYGGTEDLAEVIDAYVAQDKYLSDSDTASVVILSPVGGEVALTPLQAASPYLVAALVLASALVLKRRMGSL